MTLCCWRRRLMTVSKKTTPRSLAAKACMSVFMKFWLNVKRNLGDGDETHLDLLPCIVVGFQRAEVMLKRDDEAVTVDETFVLGQTEVDAGAEGDERRSRLRCRLLKAVRTGVERFLCLGVVCAHLSVLPTSRQVCAHR